MIVHFNQCQVNLNQYGEREVYIFENGRTYLCKCEYVPIKFQQIYAYWLGMQNLSFPECLDESIVPDSLPFDFYIEFDDDVLEELVM